MKYIISFNNFNGKRLKKVESNKCKMKIINSSQKWT